MIDDLLINDLQRMRVLNIVKSLDLSYCYVAAGFLRNMVWDYLHNKTTPLNDIDVVFYDAEDSDNARAEATQTFLNKQYPEYTWEVKNQAFMHIRNQDSPYLNTLDAMSYWPEKETAIAACLDDKGNISIISAFGLESLMEGKITYNDKRTLDIFKQRVSSKQWLEIWPNLQVVI